MKTCKKILAGVLVFAMMVSMCAFVSADEVAETETTATTGVALYKLTFDSASEGATTSWPYDEYVKIGGAAAQTNITFRQAKFGSNGLSGTIVQKAEGDNYMSHSSTWSGANFRQTPNEITAKYPDAGYSVMKISYDIMIPDDVEHKENKRAGNFALGATKTTNYGMVTVAPTIYKGRVYVEATGIATVKVSKEIKYTYGEWMSFDVRTWVDTDSSKLAVAVYSNDDLIYYGLSNSNAAGIAARDLNFEYANSPDMSTRVAGDGTYVWENGILTGITDSEGNVSTDVPETVVSTTCYDNILVELLPDTAKVSEAEITAATNDYVRLLDFSCNALDSKAGTKGQSVFTNTGAVSKQTIVQGGDTDNHEADAYEVIDGIYTNVTSYSYKYLLNNFRSSIDDYVSKVNGDTTTFVYSNDLNLKDFSASITGLSGLGIDVFGSDVTTAGGTVVAARKNNQINVYYNVDTDGKIYFTESASYEGKKVDGALRSEQRTVTAGEWINVKTVYEVTHGEEQYDIKVYGIYDNDVIYVNEFTLSYADYNQDGVFDDRESARISAGARQGSSGSHRLQLRSARCREIRRRALRQP